MTELAKGISKLVCVVTVKTGEDGKMFGAVTSGMIADQLKTQFDISLDKKKIHLEHPIRTLGEHEIELRLHQDVTSKLQVRVESSTPLPAPAAPPPTEARAEQPRTEKRGRRPEGQGDKGVGAADRKPRAPRPERGGRPERGPRTERAPKAEKPAKAEKAA
jgi:large subunit ribosomal protein L9